MKFVCKVDGIHFVSDFDSTLLPPCNFWGDMGMSNLEVSLKKKLWDWIFSCPSDEIGSKSNIGIALEIMGIPFEESDKFENAIPGYETMTEKEKQDYQRKFFKDKQKNPGKLPIAPDKDKLVN